MSDEDSKATLQRSLSARAVGLGRGRCWRHGRHQ
jgi:hypothetical protein